MIAILKSRLEIWKAKQKNKELTCFETFCSNRNFFLEIATVVMVLVCGAVNKYWNKRYDITISRASYKILPIIPTSLMLATEIERDHTTGASEYLRQARPDVQTTGPASHV